MGRVFNFVDEVGLAIVVLGFSEIEFRAISLLLIVPKHITLGATITSF